MGTFSPVVAPDLEPKGPKPNNHFETETYITHFGRIYRCRTQQQIHGIVGDIKINPRNSLPTSPHIVNEPFLRIDSSGIVDDRKGGVAERLNGGNVDLPKPFLATFCTLGYASLFWSWFA